VEKSCKKDTGKAPAEGIWRDPQVFHRRVEVLLWKTRDSLDLQPCLHSQNVEKLSIFAAQSRIQSTKRRSASRHLSV
jgi:hypothetical protein